MVLKLPTEAPLPFPGHLAVRGCRWRWHTSPAHPGLGVCWGLQRLPEELAVGVLVAGSARRGKAKAGRFAALHLCIAGCQMFFSHCALWLLPCEDLPDLCPSPQDVPASLPPWP